jgi:SAM-dependent methyltransferase
MSWYELSEWWIDEVVDDPAYQEVVTPLLLDVLKPEPGARYLDLGCGEGRVMRTLQSTGSETIGVEISRDLAQHAAKVGPTVVANLPDLSFLEDDSSDGAYCVLVLEHIVDVATLFKEIARVVRPNGVFALVANHPIWTAPGSTPITDDTDGEVFWRSGDYFGSGFTDEPAGEGTIRFHHRSMAELLNVAATSGWTLEKMVEQPHHEFKDQAGIPRLLACRWRLVP